MSGSLVIVGFDGPAGERELRCKVFNIVDGSELWKRVGPVPVRAVYAVPTLLDSKYKPAPQQQQQKKKTGRVRARRAGDIRAV